MELIKPMDKIGSGSVIKLENAAETLWIAIDCDFVSIDNSWPERISPGSNIAHQLDGRRVGEMVFVPRGEIKLEFKIVELESIFAFAIRKAQELIATSIENKGPVHYGVQVN